MTDTAGPFDGTPWAEAQWYRHAAMWAPGGVYGTPAASTTTGDLPLSVSALTVGLGAGRATVRGAGFERTGAAVMQAVTANTHASFFRRDRIVLRRNLATHTVTPVLIQGTPAGSPSAPAITQSEAGSWDLPMFSFLVPPGSGTTISGIVDERGWVNAGGAPVAFVSVAARDAYFPSPAANDVCAVNGVLHVYTGTKWRYEVADTFSGSTDGSGLTTINHPLGVTPASFQLTRGSFAAAAVADGRVNALSSTQAQVIVNRTTDGAALASNPVVFYYEASS